MAIRPAEQLIHKAAWLYYAHGLRRPGREAGMTPQQIVAGHVAGALMRLGWGVRFTDMSPFRAMRVDDLRRSA